VIAQSTNQPITIYETVGELSAQTTTADVLLGAGSVVLGVAAVAVVCGVALAGVLIGVRRLRRGAQSAENTTDATRLGL
jgi:hypothetical protein